MLFQLDPENAHELALGLLRAIGGMPGLVQVARRLFGVDDPLLAVEAFGLRFPNAVGLAAGMDKNALALPGWAALGFGHVEVGTVTPAPQAGNPRPRIFRLTAERALINRMGFPNRGAAVVARRLAGRPRLPLVVGGNVGKGPDTPLERAAEDYAEAARLIAPHVDYLAINVSSPNTPELRTLQAPEQIATILAGLPRTTRPVLVKLAPDLNHDVLPELVAAARAGGAAGFIATNTTLARPGISSPEAGGLSGRPLGPLALRFVERLAAVAGANLPVIAAGGIASASDANDRLAAGARLVQLYTGLIYEGPALPSRIARAIAPS